MRCGCAVVALWMRCGCAALRLAACSWRAPLRYRARWTPCFNLPTPPYTLVSRRTPTSTACATMTSTSLCGRGTATEASGGPRIGQGRQAAGPALAAAGGCRGCGSGPCVVLRRVHLGTDHLNQRFWLLRFVQGVVRFKGRGGPGTVPSFSLFCVSHYHRRARLLLGRLGCAELLVVIPSFMTSLRLMSLGTVGRRGAGQPLFVQLALQGGHAT